MLHSACHACGCIILVQTRQVVSKIKVPYDAFQNDYSSTTMLFEKFDEWRTVLPSASNKYIDEVVKSYIMLAMSGIAELGKLPDVHVLIKPTRSVFAKKSFAKGQVMLVPQALRPSSVDSADPVPPSGYEVNVPDHLTSRKKYFIAPMCSKEFCSLVACIRRTDDEDKVNLGVQYKKITIGSASGAGKGKHSSSVEIGIPVITNTRAIAANEEFFMMQPEAPPPAKRAKRGLHSVAEPVPTATSKRKR